MPSAKEDMDEARMLIEQANLEERCLEEATAAAECVRNLKDAMEITSSEWRAFAQCSVFVIGGIAILVLAPGQRSVNDGIAFVLVNGFLLGMVGSCCGLALRLVIRILKRIKRAKNALKVATMQLKNCLRP